MLFFFCQNNLKHNFQTGHLGRFIFYVWNIQQGLALPFNQLCITETLYKDTMVLTVYSIKIFMTAWTDLDQRHSNRDWALRQFLLATFLSACASTSVATGTGNTSKFYD